MDNPGDLSRSTLHALSVKKPGFIANRQQKKQHLLEDAAPHPFDSSYAIFAFGLSKKPNRRCSNASTSAPRKAAVHVITANPGTNTLENFRITALMIRKKRPNVR